MKNHFGFHDFVLRPWPIVHSKYIDWLPGTSSTILFVSLVRFMLFCALRRSINPFFYLAVVIFLGGILMLTRTAAISVHMSNPLELGVTWETYAYVSFYTLEACLKIFGMGSHDYFTSGWNCFDFTVTGVSLIGLAAEILGHWSFLVVARHLR